MQNASSEVVTAENCRRRVLSSVIASILHETGFHTVEKDALGTLVEMFQSLLHEIGRTSKTYCEIAYRTEPVIGDLIVSFAELGLKIDGLHAFAKKTRIPINHPGQQMDSKCNNVLQVGDKKQHLPHIPDSFPAFPDTHTYCFSHTYKQPVTEYEAIREKSAQQKKDIEKALTKFGTKTNDADDLFLLEDKEHLLIAVRPTTRPFHDALMPRDQVFEEDELHLANLNRRRREERAEGSDSKDKDKETTDPDVENPYLKTVKMPRKKQKKSTHHS